ncbi:SIMPL domain-containing protein [Faecalibacter macacae]|uniref:DUF541 domain-containing protein n=1 Tax=Faecalibacter macacae TaxID=1859289 RepID=A0A3L9MAV9_9FLAO|nr:SIMPL domain-containing protein [Faecalibacter macacae]RLZ09106.1 DUF541 domain-containing protein [Faecalibacter macacae]
MKKQSLLFFTLFSTALFAQEKNFIDQPFIETAAKVDTLVSPDRIYLTIILSEKDSKNKISVEELENKMASKLTSLGIDLKKQLSMQDLASNFKKYFLKQQDIVKAKSYSLLVYDAQTASKVIVGLENESISNVYLDRTEYSKLEELKLDLKSKAILKAKTIAKAMTEPIGQKVGSAIYISDHTTSNYGLAGAAPGIVVRGMSKMKVNETYQPLDIEFDKINVEASVNAKFKIE